MKTLLLAVLVTHTAVLQQEPAIVSGRLLSSDGRPASNVRIALTAAGEDSPIRRTTQTDSTGRYRIEGVLPGRYHVVAGPMERPTYLPGVVTRATASIITLNAGSSIEAAEFRLAGSGGPVGLRVKGRVNGVMPGDLTPAVVLDRIGGSMVDRKTAVIVSPDGSFEVSELQPATYEVYVFDRVVATFVLKDKDVTDLALKYPR